jgi:hypothetical protein
MMMCMPRGTSCGPIVTEKSEEKGPGLALSTFCRSYLISFTYTTASEIASSLTGSSAISSAYKDR